MSTNQNQNIDLRDKTEVVRLLSATFAKHGHQLYLVGGAVRDALIGRVARELDFATSAPPETTAEVLEASGLGSVYRVGEKFGTIGLARDGLSIEITTYRSGERYLPDSRRPEVQFGRSVYEDLARRDFTVNAIAWEPTSGTLIDPLRGIADIQAGLIRAVGDPASRFTEDPLRLLRAVRFAAELGFQIEDSTRKAIEECAFTLKRISRERIRDEYSRILKGPDPAAGLVLLRDTHLLEHSVPQLIALTQMPDHGPRHPLSLWTHVMQVVSDTPPDLRIRWAAVLHDIAKPATRTHEPDGRPRFFHHETIGADVTREILGNLRYPSRFVEDVATLVETHMQLHTYSCEWSPGAVRRLTVRLGDLTHAAIALARADARGHAIPGSAVSPFADSSMKFDALEKRIEELSREQPGAPKSPLSGTDLMERYQRPPGPWIRVIKSSLEEEMLEGNLAVDDREAAWKIADRLVAHL